MNAHTDWNASTALATPVALPAYLRRFAPAKVAAVNFAPEAPGVIANPSATVERTELVEALRRVAYVAAKRDALPILTCLHAFERDGSLVVRATNLDYEIAHVIPGTVDAGFSAAIPAHLVKTILAKAKGSDLVCLTMSDETQSNGDPVTTLETERTAFDLQSRSPADFPIMPALDEPVTFDLSGDLFRDALASVAGAISTEETRYYLNGVYMHAHEGGLRMVATDGHRLYCRDVPGIDCDGMADVIVPREALQTFLKMTSAKANRTDGLALAITDLKVSLTFGATRIVTKVIDGTFPQYSRVIPTANPHHIELSTADARAAIADVSCIASDRGRAVAFTFDDGETVELSVNNPDAGTARASISYDAVTTGPVMTCGFNFKYLDELLALCGETVTMELNSPADPLRIVSTDATWQAVLMPMRV